MNTSKTETYKKNRCVKTINKNKQQKHKNAHTCIQLETLKET